MEWMGSSATFQKEVALLCMGVGGVHGRLLPEQRGKRVKARARKLLEAASEE